MQIFKWYAAIASYTHIHKKLFLQVNTVTHKMYQLKIKSYAHPMLHTHKQTQVTNQKLHTNPILHTHRQTQVTNLKTHTQIQNYTHTHTQADTS